MIDLNKLKAAAEAAKAYQPDAIKAHSFGCFDEEGVFYDLGNVCARIYERDENSDGSSADDALLNHIIAASPDAVLELIAMASAAAPQVVADERKGSPYPEYDRGFSNGWDACAKREAAPVQAQEPVAEIHCQEFHELAMDYRGASFSKAPMAYKSLCEYIKRLVAPVQPVAMPEGWKLVPVVATPEMLEKNNYKHEVPCGYENFGIDDSILPSIWASMVADAPAAPAAQGDAKPDMRKVVSEALSAYTIEGGRDDEFNECVDTLCAAIAAKAAS